MSILVNVCIVLYTSMHNSIEFSMCIHRLCSDLLAHTHTHITDIFIQHQRVYMSACHFINVRLQAHYIKCSCLTRCLQVEVQETGG